MELAFGVASTQAWASIHSDGSEGESDSDNVPTVVEHYTPPTSARPPAKAAPAASPPTNATALAAHPRERALGAAPVRVGDRSQRRYARVARAPRFAWLTTRTRCPPDTAHVGAGWLAAATRPVQRWRQRHYQLQPAWACEACAGVFP